MTDQIEGKNNLVIDKIRPEKGEVLEAYISADRKVRVETARERELRRKKEFLEQLLSSLQRIELTSTNFILSAETAPTKEPNEHPEPEIYEEDERKFEYYEETDDTPELETSPHPEEPDSIIDKAPIRTRFPKSLKLH